MGVTHSLEICTLSQTTLYKNLTFSSTKVFPRTCSRLAVTAHQQTQMWPGWRRHISVSTAPFKGTSASCSHLTPSILSTTVTLTTHSAEVQRSQKALEVLRNQEARTSPPCSQVRSNLWGQLR